MTKEKGMKEFARNMGITLLCLGVSTLLAFFLFHFGNRSSANITLVYILALIVIALKTRGYWYGVCSAVFCIAAINTFFTYPFFKMDFSLDGYPVTFIAMLTISVITSMMTTRLKQQREELDIRERKIAETEKERLRANLLRAVSHDLRTPLTSIIGASASYLEDYENLDRTERLEFVANINGDAKWLLNMVENLLTVTRIQDDTGKVKTSVEVVEEVVAEAITRARKRCPNLKVEVDLPEEILMISMDATLIEQVLINLMENAHIHGMGERPVKLQIENLDDTVAFHVRDYGVGLDEAQIPTIFDGKYEAKVADGNRGLGIGLTICKTIVTAHNGTIEARNCGDGAEFVFKLPKEKVNEYDT